MSLPALILRAKRRPPPPPPLPGVRKKRVSRQRAAEAKRVQPFACVLFVGVVECATVRFTLI